MFKPHRNTPVRSHSSEYVHVLIRYGDEAGQAANTAVQSAVNVGVTAFNVDNLGIKGVLKATGKQTAKEMVKDGSGSEGTEEKEKPPKKGQDEKK